MKTQVPIVIATAMALAALGQAATAQQPLAPPALELVDPTVADVSALSESFRDMQVDLRQPLGFTQVYRLPGDEEKFARVSGALFAVFPLSDYAQSRRGPIALIPSGTIFYMGQPPATPSKSDDEKPMGTALVQIVDDRRESKLNRFVPTYVDTRVKDDEASQPLPETASDEVSDGVAPRMPRQGLRRDAGVVIQSIATDEAYRARRVGELLTQAAAAHVSQGGDSLK